MLKKASVVPLMIVCLLMTAVFMPMASIDSEAVELDPDWDDSPNTVGAADNFVSDTEKTGSKTSLAPHAPIRINGNIDFDAAHGVTGGSGTYWDPWILEDYDIDGTGFGSITVNGELFDHDIVIRLSGIVKKRKKKLSKQQYGTSHTVSLAEAEHIFEHGAEHIIVGTGQYGVLKLSAEAEAFFKEQGCDVRAAPTPDAVKAWNEAGGKTIAMFHVTC